MVVIATFVYICIHVVIPHHTLLRLILAVGQLSVGSPPPLKSTRYTAVYALLITIHTEHNVVHVHTHTHTCILHTNFSMYIREGSDQLKVTIQFHLLPTNTLSHKQSYL